MNYTGKVGRYETKEKSELQNQKIQTEQPKVNNKKAQTDTKLMA